MQSYKKKIAKNMLKKHLIKIINKGNMFNEEKLSEKLEQFTNQLFNHDKDWGEMFKEKFNNVKNDIIVKDNKVMFLVPGYNKSEIKTQMVNNDTIVVTAKNDLMGDKKLSYKINDKKIDNGSLDLGVLTITLKENNNTKDINIL